MHSFDPRAVGKWETRAWETYYRRKWASFLIASVMLVRAAFRMPWRDTVAGAWLVLRANQKWAPVPNNNPAAACAYMERFYRRLPVADPRRAAELEVEWWRAHREHQRAGVPADELIDALTDLYSFTYAGEGAQLRRAAEWRAEAMAVSDRWVADGCDPADSRLAEERALLVRSYAALLAAVHRPG